MDQPWPLHEHFATSLRRQQFIGCDQRSLWNFQTEPGQNNDAHETGRRYRPAALIKMKRADAFHEDAIHLIDSMPAPPSAILVKLEYAIFRWSIAECDPDRRCHHCERVWLAGLRNSEGHSVQQRRRNAHRRALARDATARPL